MIVGNVPFCTSRRTPRTLATALRRSTSSPTFWPLTWPTCGSPDVPGWRVVPRISCPLLRTLAGSWACSVASSLTADTTSWVGIAIDVEAGLAPPDADVDALAPAELPALVVEPPDDEPQAVRVSATATRAPTARRRRSVFTAGP